MDIKVKKAGLVLIGLLFLVLVGLPHESGAQVSVNINIGPPPAYVFHAPPPVVVIPQTYVYVVPEIAVEIFFYHGYWYRPHEKHWYRAHSYNGPWAYLALAKVPVVLVELPPYYRSVPPGHSHIPYGQVKKNWKKWEKEKYWERDREWHEGWHGEHEDKGHGKDDKGHGGQGNGGHGGHPGKK
jgi:hypothetical protein